METPKALNFFYCIASGLGSSLGIGIYVLLGDVVKNGPGLSFVVTILLTGVTAFLAGLIFTEFSVWFLKANSSYPFFYSCGNENIAFILGWILILKHVAGTACVVKGVLTFIDALTEEKISTFLTNTLPLNTAYISPYFDFISVIVVIILTFLLVCGVRDNLIVKSIFTAFNFTLLLAVIIAGALNANPENWHTEESLNTERACDFVPIAKQAAVLFIGFIGFDTIGLTDEEVKKRQKIVPAAVFGTLLITLLAFSGVGYILILITPHYNIVSGASLPFAFERIGWTIMKWVVVVGAFFGFQTSLFGIVYPLPRIIIGLANDGILCHCLGKYNSKTNTPVLAVLSSSLLISVACGFFTFTQLISLTVISTLFVLTVLTLNIILLRHTPKFTEEVAISTTSLYESTFKDSPPSKPINFKNIFINLFNCKQKTTTNITKIITSVDLFLYGFSCVALSILLIYYFEFIKSFQFEYVVFSSVALGILILSLASLMCQPKSDVPFFFKVPLTPIVPCLSIFLNVLLSVSFGVTSWIYFAIWLGIGTIPYLIWYFFRCRKSLINETSIYEINRVNALKLNEAVWKIISERPSFLEGRSNPAFNEESDEKSEVIKINAIDERVKINNEKFPLKLNKTEIFQRAEVVPEEKIEPLVIEGEPKILSEEEKVEWQCVAEIHNSEEFSQESVVLEIVDTTYNFLSDALTNDGDSISQKSEDTLKELSDKGDNSLLRMSPKKPPQSNFLQNRDSPSPPPMSKESQTPRPTPLFSRKLLDEIHDTIRIKKERMQAQSEKNLLFPDKINKDDELKEINQSEQKFSVFEKENKMEKILSTTSESPKAQVTKLDVEEKIDDKAQEKPLTNEQSKVKEFKEKLNQLLKNQIDINSTFGKSFLNTKSISKKDSEVANAVNNEDEELYKTVKTLNKVQIKGKLELLLSKGPPKRPSLKNSFGIKIKESDKEGVSEKKENTEVGKTEVVT